MYLYTCSNDGKVTEQKYKENANATPVTQFTYSYNNEGELITKIDYGAHQKTVYGENNLVTVYAPENAQEVAENEVYSYYDREETTETQTDPNTNEEIQVTNPATSSRKYGSKNFVTTITDNTATYKLNNTDFLTVETTENEQQRKESKELKDANDNRILKTEYTYDENGNVSQSSISTGSNYAASMSYSYDSKGRLTEYQQDFAEDNDIQLNYSYTNNRLTREDILDGNEGKTYTHSYDSRGNYLTLNEYDYTEGSLQNETPTQSDIIDLEYEDDIWLDEVTSAMGTEIFYDEQGNPLTVGDCEFVWTNGRQLKEIINSNTNLSVASFTYDENGYRTSRTSGNETVYYTNVNGNITSQYTLDSQGNKDDEMIFLYDGDEIIGLKYNNHTYYYVKNVFGDVTAILNEQGLNIVEYLYTAWGQVYSSVHRFGTNGDVDNLLELNPIKFRSYYYDADFSMYYLQSRYYWTPICRFLNADLPEYAQVQKNDQDGINLFAYCCNDPVNNADPTGTSKINKSIGTYVFYYHNKHGHNLDDVAKHSRYFSVQQNDVKLISVSCFKEFKEKWNNIKKAKSIYLFLHGYKGHISFYGQNIDSNTVYNSLKTIKVINNVYLFSCHGGDGNNKNNVAFSFAKLTNTSVIASPVGVSYGFGTGNTNRYAKIELKWYYLKFNNSYWHKYSVKKNNRGKWEYSNYNLGIKEIL